MPGRDSNHGTQPFGHAVGRDRQEAGCADEPILRLRYSSHSGCRHSARGAQPGAALSLQLKEANQANPKAVLINTAKGQRIGYVPDWLCGDVHDLIKAGWSVTAAAEQVNPDALAHVRVLCRIDAQCI